MAELINIANVTEADLNGDGSFDRLMKAVRLHINDAVAKNEITQSEAGQIYTNVIPSIIQFSIEFELKKQLTNMQIQQEELKVQITENEKYVSDNNKAISDKQLAMADKDLTIKEYERQLKAQEAGENPIKYFYYWAYYDAKGVKIFIDPVDNSGNTLDYIPADKRTVQETVTYYGYLNSKLDWVNTKNLESTNMDIERFHISYYKNGEIIDTDVQYTLDNKQYITGDVFVLRSKDGGILIVFKNYTEDDGTAKFLLKGSYADSFENLTYLDEDNTKRHKTPSEYASLYDEYTNDSSASKFDNVEYFIQTTTFANDSNVFNYIENINTVLCDGQDHGDGLGVRPNFTETLTHNVFIDQSRVYSKQVDNSGVTESIVAKQMHELDTKRQLLEAQTDAFKFNNFIKAYSSIADVWATGFSALPSEDFWPSDFNGSSFNAIINSVKDAANKYKP